MTMLRKIVMAGLHWFIIVILTFRDRVFSEIRAHHSISNVEECRTLGPVKHGQPGLCDALSIENFHQGNKVPPYFQDSKQPHGIRPEWYKMRKRFYRDPFPYRHQHDFLAKNPSLLPDGITIEDVNDTVKKAKKAKAKVKSRKETKSKKKHDDDENENENEKKTAQVNASDPHTFSVWITPTGELKKMAYVKSRQIYCHAFELLVQREPDWIKLTNLIRDGTNICICGFDAQPLNRSSNVRYLDASRPFGHEDVIITMLLDPPETWPWKVHRTETFNFTI